MDPTKEIRKYRKQPSTRLARLSFFTYDSFLSHYYAVYYFNILVGELLLFCSDLVSI
jgi:hypothetical protein